MSVRAMARVWAESRHSGSELLMLLAIADFADDQGNAYPAVATLAEKCRMKPRNANYVLAALQASGELKVTLNGGPRGSNRYKVMLDALGVQEIAGVQSAAGVQRSAPTPATQCAKPLHCIAAKPPLNRQEPSDTTLARGRKRGPRIPDCPFEQVIAAYHDILPELPRALVLAKKRKATITGAWRFVFTQPRADGSPRATTQDEAVAWFREFFEAVRGIGWLMGEGTPRPGHENWKCSIDYLLSERGLTRVIEHQD
jgi:hypothetical protein